ncbi:N-6 DNA methylase [Psychroserpens algicola]|uniref:N-6 DNA methylase n=1 Tax=Psychroserpens algicola TaxID=1719034 RepID=UPI001952FCEB|nr:N-6 DNA methylase [Psychroserpens algicola]
MNTQQVIDKIFKDPAVKYELSEFEGLGTPIHEMINIYSKDGTGRQTGKKIYYIKPLAPMYSEKEELQVYVENGKSAPEEIIRQLWLFKLLNFYGYNKDQIVCEIPVRYGTEVNPKGADIAVYRDNSKETVKILFEIKKPKRKDGIAQLKSYLGANGNPIGVWSNGTDRLILYKPKNKDFDTLSEIPKVNEEEKDVLEIKRTLTQLKTSFNFKKIIQDLEELVLADSGVDEFNEIFKIIFAKIWDEKEANENKRTRPNKEVEFKKFEDPELTYDKINGLFKKACNEWQGVFEDNENIKLRKDHLQVCIGPVEPVRLMGSNLRIMDDAFEYLLPTEAKKKKGQFFTPRHVIEMCVRMLNPQDDEYVMDPSCGSAGFLLHAMEWAVPADTVQEQELRKHRYAGKYLWGIDFEARAAKTSRALMLIAGDGHTNIFGPDVSSIDPRTWYTTKSGQYLMTELSKTKLLKAKIPEGETFKDDDKAWEYFGEMNFDVILANPPFAGEMKNKKMLSQYDLAKPAIKRAKDKTPKEERDVLFIERIVKMLRPGGRAAIVLPQGKFNNSSLAFIREWILRKARLLGVVGLHGNSFKPHTGTKTSVLFIQKYTDEELADIIKVQKEVESKCPDYAKQIEDVLAQFEEEIDIPEDKIAEEIFELLLEEYPEPEIEDETTDVDSEEEEDDESNEPLSLEDKLEIIDEKIDDLKNGLLKAKTKLAGLDDELEALKHTRDAELEIAKERFDKEITSLNEQKKSISLSGLSTDEKTKAKEFKDKLTEDIKTQRAAKTQEQKDIKAKYKLKEKELKDSRINPIKKTLKAEIKLFEKQIPLAEEEKLLLTNKGKLQLLLNNEDSIEKIRNRYIDAEVAKQLDYPIFMAVSERGGKNNSGDYEYMLDDDGNLIEDDFGNPEIDQDLVNHSITRDDLLTPDFDFEKADLNIAEAFVQFSKEQGFDFWKN